MNISTGQTVINRPNFAQVPQNRCPVCGTKVFAKMKVTVELIKLATEGQMREELALRGFEHINRANGSQA